MGKTPEDRYLVPGLLRGLRVLQAFTEARPRRTPADLARDLGVSRSALFRVLYTLTEQGFLLHDPRGGYYALGPEVLALSRGLARRELLARAWPVLERLRDATGWSAHLGVLEGAEVVYLLRVAAARDRRSIVHVGSRLPAEATAMGRMLLAESAGAQGTLPARLLRRARQDRARGHVLHLGEFEQGIASIAAPVRDADGRAIAAINISAALREAAEARRPALLRATLAAASEISLAPPPPAATP
jgi:DNA-binding IclR family transcriptional regulator